MFVKELTCEPDVRPFGCTWKSCDKAFSRRSDMTRHYKIHINDRPHPCKAPGCDKRFIQRSALVVHIRTHTGEKPHECQYPGCMKRFSDSSSLSRHRHIHTRTRPRRCGHIECPKSICRRQPVAKIEQQPPQRAFFNVPADKYASDSEPSQSPSVPSQPATPQPATPQTLQDNMACQVSILQEDMIEDIPSMAKYDGQICNCYMHQLFHPLHSIVDDELLGSIPLQSLLYGKGQDNAGLETINRSSQYRDLTEQVHQPAMGTCMSYTPPDLSNAPNSSATALSSVSQDNHAIPGGYSMPYGEYSDVYPLFNTSPIKRYEQEMAYSQQLPQMQHQMFIRPEQILIHATEIYIPPSPLVKPEPWYGFESHLL